MTNVEKRIKELYDKMQRTGLDRNERVELTALEARADVNRLQQIEADKVKAEAEKEREQIREEREQMAAQQAATDRGLRILAIFRTGYQVDGVQKFLTFNEANERQIELTNPGEEPSPEWFADVLEQQPKLASSFVWKRPVDPFEKKLQEEGDRDTFAKLCRTEGIHISENEANFKLLHDTLGAGFNLYAAIQAVNSNAVLVSPATPKEIQERIAERVEQRNFDLVYRTDIPTLKKLTREEAEQRRVETAQADAKRVLDIKRQFQDGRFELLPSQWKGEVLDANFIKKAKPELIRLLKTRFGSYQLDLRLRGETA
jgi:hypothetical protein